MIGPYFFENDDETTVTVNSEHYSHMITESFMPAIEEYDLENMWFQKDVVTCHTTRAKMALLQKIFPGRVISHRGDINWPPRSCDLKPLDFFCETTRKTEFVQINLQLLSTSEPILVNLWLRCRPICVEKCSKITSKESMLATLLAEVI